MAAPLSMVFDLLAVDRASAVFARVGEAATLAGGKAETGMAKVAAAGTKMAKGFTLAGVAAAAVSVKMAGDFQQSTNILVTAAGESQSALDMVRKGILDIAKNTGTNWQSLTDGMYQIEKAGLRGADGLKVLKAAAQAAREEGADLATVTSATTSVLASYYGADKDHGASKAVMVTNELKTAAGEAKTTMELFAGSLSTVLPLASANNISFADIAGSLAMLTQHGTSADQAAQELAFTMRGLAAPNNVAVQAMNQLGISSTDVALKLGDGPGGRGLAGTLKYLSDTVLTRMGPDGLVLLDSFKKSTTAADDLQKMLAKMPPQVKDLSQKFLDGSISVGDYRTAFKSLPTDQASMARQFITLAGTSQGFNDQLKRGGPAAATFSDQIKKMTGGANGLNTVLQLTGGSMGGTEERIARIAAAAQAAGEDVQGWASTQGLFNVQLDRFKQSVAAAAIDLGTKLLPAVTGFIGFLSDHQTSLEVFAGGILAVAAGVTAYVAAVKLAALAEGAWNAVALLGNTTLGIRVGLLGLSAKASIQAAAANDTLTGSLARGSLAAGSWAASAGKAAGTLGAFVGIAYELDKHAGGLLFPFEKAAPSVDKLTSSLLTASDSGAAGKLSGDFDKLGKSLADAQKSLLNAQLNPFSSGFWSPGSSANIHAADAEVKSLDKTLTAMVASGSGPQAAAAFDKLAAAAKSHGASIDDVKKSLPGYEAALGGAATQAGNLGTKEGAAATSADNLKGAQDKLKTAQDKLNGSLQDSINAFTILNQGALTQEQAAQDLTTKTAELAASHKENGNSLDLSTAKGVANRQAIIGLITSTNEKITADFKSTESSSGLATATAAMSDQVVANKGHLIELITKQGFTQASAKAMADQFLLTPEQIMTQFNTPGVTEAQNNVIGLQQDIDSLSDKDIHINAYLNSFASTAAFQAAGNSGNKSQASKLNNLGMATGGVVPMLPGAVAGRDSVGTMLMPGEFVVRTDGSNLGDAVAHFGNRMAQGGLVQRHVNTAFGGFDSGALSSSIVGGLNNLVSSVTAAAQKQAQSYGSPGGAGGAARWAPLVDQVLAMLGQPLSLEAGVLSLINKESGGNPNAINLTDSNARAGHPSQGLMQTIPGTFRAYAGPFVGRGITDPLANIYAGVNYTLHRYGPGMLAAGGRHNSSGGYVGYEKGTDYVPSTGLALLHQGEAVLTKTQNAARRAHGAAAQSAVFHLYDTNNVLLGTIDGRIDAADAMVATSMNHA